MVTGEDGRLGVHVTQQVTVKLKLDNASTRLPIVEEHLVLDPQPILTRTCVRTVSISTSTAVHKLVS